LIALWFSLVTLPGEADASSETGQLAKWFAKSGVETIWQIGAFDGRPSEFGLAPGRAGEFAGKFGEKVTFRVGESKLADFPFLQPSEKDTAWGGRPAVPFVIEFSLPAVQPDGYFLFIALTDAHERFPSKMEVAVNGGIVWEKAMPLGRGRAFYGDFRDTAPRTMMAPVPAENLRCGENQLVITLRGGSWVSYDALALRHAGRLDGEPPAPEPLAGFESADNKLFEGDGAYVLPTQTGVRVFAPPGNKAVFSRPLPSDGFDAEFYVRTCDGSWNIEYQLPEGARGPAWQVKYAQSGGKGHISLEETPLSRAGGAASAVPAGWLRVCIAHRPSRTTIETWAGNRRLTQQAAFHVPTPDGTLVWTAGSKGAHFDIAHLRWRPVPVEPLPVEGTTAASSSVAQDVSYDTITGQVRLVSGRLALCVQTRDGLNPNSLVDAQTGYAYADSDYAWPGGRFPSLVAEPEISRCADGSRSVRFLARLDKLEIEQTFSAPVSATDTIAETIRMRNTGKRPLDTSGFACGFAKRVYSEKGWHLDAENTRFTAIPYRRETESGNFCDFAVPELLWRSGWCGVCPFLVSKGKLYSSAFGSEAWAWSQGNSALMLLKYNPDAMEWSLLEPVWRGSDMVLRFAGAGQWKLNDPDSASRLEPDASFSWGTTRIQAVPGTWKEAFGVFRGFMDTRGHHFPEDYNPPVHWNELYDNPLWWGPDTPTRRAEFYGMKDMIAEAEKAHELGCEALYFDPGWDTSMASSVWDAGRLGAQADFARMLREKYGLAMAFHTPLAAWSDVAAYPEEARKMNQDGKRSAGLCSAAPAYLDSKTQRLLELCRNGAAFLMYDGSWFTGECWDPSHGHKLPLTHQEHCDACYELSRRVHEAFPNVLIEQHDPMTGGFNIRQAPTYFLHGKPGSFDELWGYEYMWDPMADLLEGRALSLYYANLAYNIPYYLHIDLRKDNENALVFWWYASTCRHLGVGGKHPDPKVWEAHRAAMREYLRLKPFYTRGVFYGLDETVHVHTLPGARPEETKAVMNVFNLGTTAIEREIRFRRADIGFAPSANLRVEGALYRALPGDDEVAVWVRLPSQSHRLVEIHAQ
jgi:hypothetical protein